MSKKKIIIIIGAVLLVLAGGVGAAIWTGIIDLNSMFSESAEEKPEVVMLDDPDFYPLEEFVVSLPQPSSARFMMVEISLMSHDPRMEEVVVEMNSVIRNTMLQYFSGKTLEQLQKELANIAEFQKNMRDALVSASTNYKNKIPVEKVLLTNVIVQ